MAHCKVLIHNFTCIKTFYQALPSTEDQVIDLFVGIYTQEANVDEIGKTCDKENFTAIIMGVGLNLA